MASARALVTLVLAGFVATLVGCGNGDDTRVDPPPTPGADAAADATKNDAAKGDAEVADSTVKMDVEAGSVGDADSAVTDGVSSGLALLRVANWSPDAPPVDFCLAPHGTTAFAGPLLAAQASTLDEGGVIDGGAAALSFPNVSAYFLVAPGQYDARVVTAGASCSTGIPADATNLPGLVAGGATTLALVGEAQPTADAGSTALGLVGFQDTTATTTSSILALRFVNALPSVPQLDVGEENGGVFAPLFSGIGYGFAGTLHQAQQATAADASRPSVDPNGYLTIVSGLAGVTIASRAPAAMDAASADLAVSAPVNAAAGAVLTIAVLGPSPQAEAGASHSAQLLECIDNAGTVGLLGNCTVISR